MEQNFSNKGEQLVKKRIRWKRWRKIFSVLACVVVFCTTYALILPAITIEKKASCGYEEHPGHSKELGCFEEVTTLTCGQEETPGHTHSDECYEIVTTLVCGMEEGEEHTHDDMCYSTTTVLVCTEAETPGHTHTEECYTTEEQLVCTKPIHSHSLNCYEKEETEVKDSKEEQTTDEKSKDRSDQTTDEKSENHSDKTVDVESRSDWEKTLEGVKLTGYWDKDIVAIAESQLGYAESTRNYVVQDGRRFGYSRYGQWYGNAYGDWCAMFVSYCLHYADVDEALMPRDANCQNWINVLTKEDNLDKKDRVHDYHYYRSDAYLPKAGDLIFFDWDGYKNEEDRVSDHIGIVAELLTDRKGNVEKVKTIEGNSSDKVQYVTYDIDDVNIMGYGELPINPEKADEIIEKTVEERTYTVTVKYPRKTKISEDAELVAEEYSKRSDEYKARYAEAAEFYGWTEEDDFRDDFRLFNIGLYEYNRELQPEGEVDVQITYKKQKKLDEKILQVTHFSDEIEKIKVTSKNEDSKEIIDFKTEGFSDFGVLLMDDADLDMSFDTFEEESIMLLAAASDNDSNLLAYFKFDGNLNDSSGNNAKATINGNNTYQYSVLAANVYNGRSLNMAYNASSNYNGYGNYLTITKADGTPLLTGYDEVSFDFWMKAVAKSANTTGDTTNQWAIYAAPNNNPPTYQKEKFIGFLVNSGVTRGSAERFLTGRDNGEPTANVNANYNGGMVHVHVDYNQNNTVLTVTDNTGTHTQTVANDKSIKDILGNNSILQIGKANWANGEFFNGYIDELKIYGKKSEDTTDYHVCADNEIAHVSFDGRDGWQWRDDTTDDTGKAQFRTETGSSNNNSLTNGVSDQAPVKKIEGNIYQCSAQLFAKEQDIITIQAKGGGDLLRGKGYNQFAVDFWSRANTLRTDDTNYGLFSIGTSKRAIEAYIDKDNTKTIVLSTPSNGHTTTISCTENLLGKMLYYQLSYSGQRATLSVYNEAGRLLGQGTLNTGMNFDTIFTNTDNPTEVITFGDTYRGATTDEHNYYDGVFDDIKIYSSVSALPTVSQTSVGGTHPLTAYTHQMDAKDVFLLNIDTNHQTGKPLAGVTYTVYGPDGNAVASYVTSNEYVLDLPGLRQGVEYTIKQTAVPDGYVVTEQTKTFTIPTGHDSVVEVGVFFDYAENEGYNPDKTAEVYDYENRIYDVTLSALSGLTNVSIQKKNFDFVVDQSNSMLFPAVLAKTNVYADLYYHSGSAPGGKTNSEILDEVFAENGLRTDQVYYIVANETGKATVIAIWKSSYNGRWYYQDAAYYAQAQAGTERPDGNGVYQYSDYNNEGNSPDINLTGTLDSGGCWDGNGNSNVTSVSDLSNDLRDVTFGATADGRGPEDTGSNNTAHKSYMLYTGSEYNRLTYLKYALKRLIYQLSAMGSENTVTVTTFDNNLEACKTATIDAQHPQEMLDMIQFIDGIQTNGGTSQNYGLFHIVGKHATIAGANKSGCDGNHLSDTVNNYIIMITDGALNARHDNATAYVEGANQREDFFKSEEAIRAADPNVEIITVGLSVQDVTLAQEILNDKAHGGIADPGLAFLDNDADELAETLTNALLKDLLELDVVDDHATIRDYISDSFYPVDKDGVVLPEGQWLTLQGEKTSAGAANAAGQLKHDSKGWYVKWTNQKLEANKTGDHIIYTYTDDNGTVTQIDPSVIYYIDYNSKRAISGSGPFDSTIDKLMWENGEWIYRWRDYNGDTERRDSVGNRVNSMTDEYSPETWNGKFYVKAKEDFIGGNTIDTNKGDAEIILLDSNNEPRSTIELETPTVNVHLLPINEVHSEETVFLGDPVEDLNTKLSNLWNQLEFTKLVNNGDDVHNKTDATDTAGLNAGTFTPGYAMGNASMLTVEQWEELFKGETITVPYTYDDASSHGEVGYFTIKLEKDIREGENEGYEDHVSSLTGEAVERYTLTLDYTAYTITDGDRPDDVHNYGNGPGTEVGGPNSGDTLETGHGIVESVNTHLVHVIDGEIYLTKIIDQSLISDKDQTYTFDLYHKNSTTGEAEGDSLRTVTVTVKAGETEGTIHIENLPRNNYIVKEATSDVYKVDGVEIVSNDTTCDSKPGTSDLEFDIGTNENSSGINHNVIIYNSSPKYEHSMWEDEDRYVYSKPFKTVDNAGNTEGGSGSGSGTHTEQREVETYAWPSGVIISNNTSGAQYSSMAKSASELDANHTSYGVLTQNPIDEDDWTVIWTSWTSEEKTNTTYNWPVGTLISTNTSGNKYVKLDGTQESLDNSHTSYGVLKKNSNDDWVIEWHEWTSSQVPVSTGNGTYEAVLISYLHTAPPNLSSYANNGYYYKNSSGNYELITAIRATDYNIIITTPNRPDGYYVQESDGLDTHGWEVIGNIGATRVKFTIYKKNTGTGYETIWSDSNRTENAVVSKLPTTTTTETIWTKETSTAVGADITKIPKTTKTIEVEVPDATDDGSGTLVPEVDITTLSAGHGKITNSKIDKEIEIPVEKKWQDVPEEEYEEQAVYVALYKDDEPLNIALRLDKDNNWKGSFKVSYTNGEDIFGEHGYSVRELSNVAADGKIYQFSSAKLINVDPLDDGEYPVIYYQEALTSGLMKSGYNIYEVEISKEAIASDDTGSQGSTGSQNQKFVVTNKDTYELPETGGIGTTLYTLGGAFLMIVSLLYGLLLRRRRERRLY